MKHISYGSSTIVLIVIVFVLYHVALFLPAIAWGIIGIILVCSSVGYLVGMMGVKLYAQYRLDIGGARKAPARRVASPRREVKE